MIYDIAIIGAGVAGAFAAYKVSQMGKDIKTIIFDIGRPPMKRRRQIEGWLGCLPNGDGKLYLSNLSAVSNVIGTKQTKLSNHFIFNTLSQIGTFNTIKDPLPSSKLDKKIRKSGYDIQQNDYIQLYPKEIHSLSKFMANKIDITRNVTYNFDNEVHNIFKKDGIFTIMTDYGSFEAKNVIISVGRSGWRWSNKLYSDFGIVENNDVAKYGIRFEISSSYMREFNKSSCSLKKDNIEIGPFNWNGTVIPEDHVDLAISSFRSNESRWKTEKVSFTLIGDHKFMNCGVEQTDRIGKLIFILANDRILKEKVSHVLSNKSLLSIIPEYNWIKSAIIDFSEVVPEVLTKGYFHVPTITPSVPKINIDSTCQTDIDGMFVTGESAGVHGILSAACMGVSVIDSICNINKY